MSTTVETVTVTQTETVVETVEQGTVVVTGVMGPPGVQGPQGPQGPQGEPGIGAGNIKLDDLTDVSAANPAADAILVYSAASTSWVASTQIITVTVPLQLNQTWQETGIQGNNYLETGSYFVQLYANDTSANGTNSNEYYSGIMSWYSGSTNSSLEMPTDEIVLHRAGGSGDGALYLRTYRSPAGDSRKLRLQIYSNIATASTANYVFYFKRIM